MLKALCYDSIRWYLRLDALLDRLLARPGQRLAPELRALAIVGLCQLLYTDIPAHAAVAETVDAARLLGQPRAAGLINALLRRCQREHTQLLPAIDRDRALRSAHPEWLVRALAADWGEHSDAILAANNERPPFWVRVNRLCVAGAAYRKQLEAAGIHVAASLFDDEALRLEAALDVAELPGFASGAVSVQDAAAQLAARLVAPRVGERVLDACAAPGGKTGHLLELQPGLDELVALDVSPRRLKRVEENLQRLGIPLQGAPARVPVRTRVQLLAADAGDPASWWDGRLFDRILLDVPCSATGVIRRHPDIKLLRRAEDIPEFAQRQLQLLQRIWPLLAPGGRLVFASCSALLAETCSVVEAFTATCPQALDVSAGVLLDGVRSGTLGGWLSGMLDGQDVAPTGSAGPTADVGVGSPGGRAGHRIPAGTAGMDGFYYACIEKRKDDEWQRARDTGA